MSRLRIILAVLSVFFFIFFHILYITCKIPFAYVNVVFLLVAILGYFSHPKFSYKMGILVWPVLLPLFIFLYKTDPASAFLSIAVFNGIQIAVLKSRGMVTDYHDMWQSRISASLERKNNMEEEFENLRKFERGTSEREMAIVNLYEVTRSMSENLKLDGMFNVLSSFLTENFKFRRCSLIVSGRDGAESPIDRVYNVWQEKGNNGVNAKAPPGKEIDYSKLIAMFNSGLKMLSISRKTDHRKFKELNIESEVTRFVGAPLLSENKMVGALMIENLPKDDVEKFLILSTQFALEIKKALLYETVERLSITDSLTGRYVRRYFSERLKEELERSERYKLNFALLVLDIDDFKRCNDSYGHLVGDIILKDISGIMEESVRGVDIVARHGGEEFAVILSETNKEGAMVVAERIRKRIEEHVFKAYDELLKMTVSIGVSVYPKDSEEAEDLIDKADTALYEAKKSGKNLVCEYKKEYNNV